MLLSLRGKMLVRLAAPAWFCSKSKTTKIFGSRKFVWNCLLSVSRLLLVKQVYTSFYIVFH